MPPKTFRRIPMSLVVLLALCALRPACAQDAFSTPDDCGAAMGFSLPGTVVYPPHFHTICPGTDLSIQGPVSIRRQPEPPGTRPEYPYTASGGVLPYAWTISSGATIDRATGLVTLSSGACGTVTITVTDSCGMTKSKTVRIEDAGRWVYCPEGQTVYCNDLVNMPHPEPDVGCSGSENPLWPPAPCDGLQRFDAGDRMRVYNRWGGGCSRLDPSDTWNLDPSTYFVHVCPDPLPVCITGRSHDFFWGTTQVTWVHFNRYSCSVWVCP